MDSQLQLWKSLPMMRIILKVVPHRSATSFASSGWLLPVNSLIELVAIVYVLCVLLRRLAFGVDNVN